VDVECITSGDRACLARFDLFRSESGTVEEVGLYQSLHDITVRSEISLIYGVVSWELQCEKIGDRSKVDLVRYNL
jgi:hypothetical protein